MIIDKQLEQFMDRAGFEPISTGGGFWAWCHTELDTDTQTLITWSDDIELGTWAQRYERQWQVGRYRSDDGSTFVCLADYETLDRALELARLMPVPKRSEQSYIAADKTLEPYYERAWREIGEDIRKGVVPANVRSFGDLHNYVDANEYGGFTEDDCPLSIEEMGQVQEALDRTLKNKGR